MDDNTRKIELARRAVACKHWRWMPGMLTRCGVRLTDGGADYIIGHRPGATRDGGGLVDTLEVGGFEPDLDDPATLGCFAFALLTAVWGDDADVDVYSDGSCGVEVPGTDPNEIERLGCPYRVGHSWGDVVAALEAAPGGGS